MPSPIVRVAVPGPLYGAYDYRWPDADVPPPRAGQRVRVAFGRQRLVAVVVAADVASDLPPERLRTVSAVLDDDPVFTEELRSLIEWAARYYHHPLGDCLATALPVLLRQGRGAEPGTDTIWRLTEAGRAVAPDTLVRRAPRQAALLSRLQARGELTAAHFPDWDGDWRGGLRRLEERGWAEATTSPAYAVIRGNGTATPPALNEAQARAAAALTGARGFTPVLVDGVTGSGKTAVYLEAIDHVVRQGDQALVIVPEIGLTPQLLDRFAARLDRPIAVLHSGLSDGERLAAWVAARDGAAAVVIGTRSAVFTPLQRPGIIVVDEEHDTSLKQQDGFRYHARDLAVVRASRLDIPIALGSATPSLESLHNARTGRYQAVHLPVRATGASLPRFRVLDMRGRPLRDGLSAPLLEQVEAHLARDGQVLLFLNRRGYAPTLLCHECGWLAECDRCDARYTFHQGARRLHCHHCDGERPVPAACPDCGSPDLRPLGLGTERVEDALRERFPDTAVVRIDRDSTRRKGEFERRLARAHSGEARLLLGTQMLAKGHHLPAVTLVGIIDADQGLFGADFRAPERLAQLVVQVAGRAGRAERAGEVVIQTHQPEHPLLTRLIADGYGPFAEEALAEREQAALPPFTSLALIRAEAVAAAPPMAFLEAAAAALNARAGPGVLCLGPMPAPMARRAGRQRAQLLLQAEDRRALQRLLGAVAPTLAALPQARRVRWSLDVDPTDTL